MIDQVLTFLNGELDPYLHVKYKLTDNIPLIQLANIWSDTQDQGSVAGANVPLNAFITLVNIEEDRISKRPENTIRRDNNTIYKNPKIHLNLYVLFAVNLSKYDESLKRLSYIIQFFQYRPVFTPADSPNLPAGVDRLIMDLTTLSFQDMNNLWGILGSKYLPSVMYKLRLITISEEFEQGDAPLIRQITFNDKSLQSS